MEKQRDSAITPVVEEEIEEKQEEEDIVDKNVHFYLVAIFLSISKLIFTWTNQTDFNFLRIDESNIIFAVEIISIPLSVINPSAWFAIFMTSLSTLCITTGYPTFAILSALLMFVTIYGAEYHKSYLAKNRGKIYQLVEISAAEKEKPMIDEKMWAEMI